MTTMSLAKISIPDQMTSSLDQDALLEGIRDKRVSKSTKSAYRSGLNRIKAWIHEHGHGSMLDEAGEINLETFKHTNFLEFVEWTNQNTTNKSSTILSYRTAIKDLYKRRGLPIPHGYESDMSDLLQGMRRHHAEQTQSGNLKDSGKRPMRFSMYQVLCLESIKMLDGGYTHLFLTLSWNLMCRSISTERIQIDHISHEQDAIGVILHKSKTDQAGDKTRTLRHIYANPFHPETCVFLALGVYFACHPHMAPTDLFEGGNQRDRFGKTLSRLLEEHFKSEASSIGTHSIRKGVATFACAGSTCGPSMASVSLRSGWTMGHVLEQYIHYDQAGDQYLGRIVAGLPNNKSTFATLPPHFPMDNTTKAKEAIAIVFPSLSTVDHLSHVLTLCLASLVFHSDWIGRTLPSYHRIKSCALFANPCLLVQLKPMVTTDSMVYTPTGVPPHVEHYKSIERNYQAIIKLPSDINQMLRDTFKSNGVSTGHITREYLDSSLSNIASQLQPPSPPTTQQQVVEVAHEKVGSLYSWSGRLSKVPSDFKFPAVDSATAWRLWWIGNARHGIPAYRYISPDDLATKKLRKQLSDWKFVMGEFESACRRQNVNLPNKPTEEDISRSYQCVMAYLKTSFSSIPSKRTRRISQLQIASLIRTLRAVKKNLTQ